MESQSGMMPPMRPFPPGSDSDLTWTRTRHFPDAWELRAGGELIGALKWPRMFSSRAEGRTSNARWVFRSPGIFSRRIEVIDETTSVGAAVLERKFGGKGDLTFPDGRRILWTFEGWVPRMPLFATTDGFPIMRFHHRFGWFRRQESIEIDPTARAMKELPLLALLGRYLMVLHRRSQNH